MGGQQMTVRDQLGSVEAYLMKGRDQFAKALPQHITPERLIRVALTAMTKNPKIMQCRPESLALALLNASALGLETNGRDAHLVPYKDQVQLIVDYKGFVQLAYRSAMVQGISARGVRAKDHFEYREGTDEFLHYKRYEGDDDPGELTHAWAMVTFANGGRKFVVLNRRDVMKRKASSASSGRSDSPWNTHEESMWAKSAVRELAKWMPQSSEMRLAEQLENNADRGVTQIPDETLGQLGNIFQPEVEGHTEEHSKSDKVAKKIAGKKQSQEVEEDDYVPIEGPYDEDKPQGKADGSLFEDEPISGDKTYPGVR